MVMMNTSNFMSEHLVLGLCPQNGVISGNVPIIFARACLRIHSSAIGRQIRFFLLTLKKYNIILQCQLSITCGGSATLAPTAGLLPWVDGKPREVWVQEGLELEWHLAECRCWSLCCFNFSAWWMLSFGRLFFCHIIPYTLRWCQQSIRLSSISAAFVLSPWYLVPILPVLDILSSMVIGLGVPCIFFLPSLIISWYCPLGFLNLWSISDLCHTRVLFVQTHDWESVKLSSRHLHCLPRTV